MKENASFRIGGWGWLIVIMGWAVGCAADTVPEPGLIFYLPFESNATAVVAGGNPAPLASSKPGPLAPGIRGTGMLQDTNTLLQYACTGNYNNAKGSLEFWVKFNTADTNQYHYLFYEEGPYADGSQILRMFTLGKAGLYYNFRDDRGRWSSAPFPMKDALGNWHQVVLTWDKDIGDRLYIDGVFQPHHGGTTTTMIHNFQRGTKSYEKMTIGLRQTKAAAGLDEVKIYDRMLSEAEVLRKYQAIFPLTVKAPQIIFRQGQAATATLTLANTTPTEVKGDLSYVITDHAGAVVKEGASPGATVVPGKPLDIAVPFTPPSAGVYRLTWTFAASDGAFSRAVSLYALPTAQAAVQPVLDPKLKLKLVKEFDCTKTYGTNEFCDDGLSRVVETPIGKYRETGTNTAFSRFAYHFTIDAPGTPYLAVVEYPDDKERIMEVMIDNKINQCGQTMESGLIMGGEFPNSDKFHEFSLLFFPPDTDCGIQLMNWPIGLGCNATAGKEDRPPAACRSIKIYKVLDGLPTTALRNLPPEPNQRKVGFEVEDCSIWRDMGAGTITYDMDFESLYLTLKRYADYMAYVGQNVFVHPMAHYTGALYPSEVVGRDLDKARSYLDFWPDLALELFRKKGITFIAGIVFWVDPGLAKEACLGPDKDGVARGEDSVLQVAWNGDLGDLGISNDLNYDILHPKVRQAYLNAVDDILNKYGDHPAFGGLSFWFLNWIGPWFASLQWGYSDRDIALFEKETGITVEIKNEECRIKNGETGSKEEMQNEKTGGKDPKRFAKRYMFLTKKDETVREKWIAWRCAKVKELWMEIYKRVQAKNPKFTLTIETWGPFPGAGTPYSIQDNWKPDDVNSIYAFYRKGGFDLNLYKDIPNLYIGKVLYHNLRPGDDAWYDQDVNYSPANIAPFQNNGANAVWLEQNRREFDNMPQATKMPGYWLTPTSHREKSAPIMPQGDFYLEYYANALANFDLRLLTSGGMGNTVLGHETELREFIRAYRALPAEPFAVFNGVDDPVCARFRQREDGYYFYLVNREFYPVEASLSFTADGKFKLLDLATGTVINGQPGRPLKVTVEPFRVLAFKAPKGVSLAAVTTSIPEANRKWLEDRIAAFRDACQSLQQQGLKINAKTQAEINWAGGEIDQAWQAKRYSRLRHLLDSYPVKKLQRILTDKTFQSYLLVPDAFVEQYFAPREIKAARVDKLPGLDPTAWEKSVAVDTFTEVMMIEGRFRPRPAPEKTTVSVLYDPERLGFFFHCADPAPDKIIAKKVAHDGNVIAPDDDSVEVFLSKTAGNIPYSQFMANFGGSRHEKVMHENPAWYNPDWTIETQKLADGWVARVVIPFKALDQTPAAGDVWGLNLCRNYRGRHMAFRCDPVKGFHCPDYFAQLKFE